MRGALPWSAAAATTIALTPPQPLPTATFPPSPVPQIKAKNPSFGITDIAKELGAMWKVISDKEKAKYEEQAKKDKVRYEKEMEKYKKK